MTLIRIDSDELAEVSGLQRTAAGVLSQAGADIVGRCCCEVPASLSGFVAAETAAIRSQLGGIGDDLARSASDLTARADAAASDTLTSVGEAAWGGGAAVAGTTAVTADGSTGFPVWLSGMDSPTPQGPTSSWTDMASAGSLGVSTMDDDPAGLFGGGFNDPYPDLTNLMANLQGGSITGGGGSTGSGMSLFNALESPPNAMLLPNGITASLDHGSTLYTDSAGNSSSNIGLATPDPISPGALMFP
jgi:hypothetical protein